ncbi:hypothetical protein C440_04868 [Haloferax mucosum ATCC BAA-1512]|uniref:Uncharacterized protein n=1 Tax=Haloferax mucosum ATCC BAA-1512 TaxID=662479 RepID=M0II47_9EURY|nr:hypothetical protein [Haloferax mucosum]ELZ96451.1 hypothetical protein C440_04868 [Haloferax mucosum ATCC BAA-1512]
MVTINDTCDACENEVEWNIEQDLQHDWCPHCGARHIISVGEREAFTHPEKSFDERRERWKDLEPLDEVMES